jgi:hypothetical protein
MSSSIAEPVTKEHVEQLIALQQRCVAARAWQCCLNCDFWSENNDLGPCLKFKARPPATTIVVGCPEWCDEIPF